MRKQGKTIVALIAMQRILDNGGTVMNAGMTDPTLYLKMLENMGCKTTAEPSYVNYPQSEVYDEITGISYITEGSKKLTGYIFKKL